MRLRISSGVLGGRFLQVAKSDTDFRPTLDRTRQSVTNRLRSRIAGAIVGDFCAGSGALGFEMVSNGALQVHFVESHRGRAEAIRDCCRTFGVVDRCTVIGTDIRTYLQSCTVRYDIVYYDPPYDDPALSSLTPRLIEVLGPAGVLVGDRRRPAQDDGQTPNPAPDDVRDFGDTRLEFHERPVDGSSVESAG